MAFSFDPSLLTSLDRVRNAIGDVVEARARLANETITALLAANSTEVWAAVAACEAIIARVAAETDFTNASLSKAASQLTDHYTKLAARLTKQAAATDSLLEAQGGKVAARPRFGGLSIAGEQALRQNTDAIQPTFAKGSDDIANGPSPEAPPWIDELRGSG